MVDVRARSALGAGGRPLFFSPFGPSKVHTSLSLASSYQQCSVTLQGKETQKLIYQLHLACACLTFSFLTFVLLPSIRSFIVRRSLWTGNVSPHHEPFMIYSSVQGNTTRVWRVCRWVGNQDSTCFFHSILWQEERVCPFAYQFLALFWEDRSRCFISHDSSLSSHHINITSLLENWPLFSSRSQSQISRQTTTSTR